MFPGYGEVSKAERTYADLKLVRLEGKSLLAPETHYAPQTNDEETDIPEEMEGILDDLFQGTQDKVPNVGPGPLTRARSECS